MRSEDLAFDRALRTRSDRLDVFPEQPEDAAFVSSLAVRCSPLAAALPASMLEHQAAAQEGSHRAQHPGAMRRIVAVDGVRSGRIVIDWGPAQRSHGVDIAVLPELRSSGVGLHLLRAWLEVADDGNWVCTLDVNRDNPAALLYEHLGFRTADDVERDSPFVRMIRPPALRLPRRRSGTSRPGRE